MTAGALVMVSLTGCASGARDADPGEPTTVRWYVEDASSYAALARACSDDSAGDFRLELVEAPADPAERRVDLLQRLRTGDDLDVIGLDTGLVAELAASDLLADLSDPVVDDLTAGRTDPSVDAVTVDGAVVAAPWTYEPQVLFHRGSAAERAGLDMTAPVTWNQVSGGAARIGGSLQVAGTTTDWVRALVAGSTDEASTDLDGLLTALAGAPGEAAGGVVRTYAASEVGPGAAPDAATAFAAPGGAFLVGPASLLLSPDLAPVVGELRVAPYPLTSASAGRSRPPVGGTSLAVAGATVHEDVAVEAITCLTDAPAQTSLVTTTGHLPTLTEVLGSTEVAETFGDDLEVLLESLVDGVPEPVSADAHLVAAAIEAAWAPVTDVQSATPADSARDARRLLDGGLA